MEQKRKVDVDIAGISMTLVTDESDSFVESVVRRMNESMNDLLKHNMKRSRLDAAMLCAIGFCSDKMTAEKRVRNLEAQISLYDVNLRKLRDEVAALKSELAEAKGGLNDGGMEQISLEKVLEGADISAESSAANASSDVSADAPEASSDSLDSQSADSEEKSDKIRMIESLLRRREPVDGGNN